MLQDDRTKAQAMGGLFDINGYMRDELKKNPPPAMRAEPAAPARPMTMLEQMDERHGKLKSRLGLFSHLYNGGSRSDYGDEDMLAAQKLSQAQAEMQQKMAAYRPGFEMLMNGTADADDPILRAMFGKDFGLDVLNAALNGGQKAVEPAWETKFNNGVLTRYDKNGTAASEVVMGPDGTPVTEKMDGDMRKTSGWFKRAVPALENMHKLEDRGVDIGRETLTLLAQQAQNDDGIVVPQLFNQALNNLNLNEDQRQYIRNGRDLAMIQLRKESGAAIGVSEMFNELEQNLMLDDFSDEGYEYQRGARGRKYRALAEGMPSYLIDEFKADGYFDTLDALRKGSSRKDPTVWDGERTDFSRFKDEDFEKIWNRLPAGEYVAPNGDRVRKPALGESVFGRKR